MWSILFFWLNVPEHRTAFYAVGASVAFCAAKLLLFFDMAMGWSGLREVLVRIACMCPYDWAKQEKK